MKKPSLIRNLLLSLLIPCTVFLVLEMIAFAKGVRLFANADSWKLFFRAVANVTLTTFALSINLDSGRFDFSLGAVSMLSATVAGTLAQQWSIGPWLTLIVAIAVAALLGLVHGGVYVLTRIPPIIVSLGMALFLKAVHLPIPVGKVFPLLLARILSAFLGLVIISW